jgi:putative Mn2+ efflux pump MntP
MAWDHWVAFILLAFLGLRMMVGGFRKPSELRPPIGQHSLKVLIFTAIATSLDALAIGVGLAFVEVNIVHTAMIIGLSTMLMATLGMLLGRFIGPILGKKAEIIGGIVLIGIGVNLLYSHIGSLAPLGS